MKENIYDQQHMNLINSLQRLKQITAPDDFGNDILSKINSTKFNTGINLIYGYNWAKIIPVSAAIIVLVVSIFFFRNEQAKSDEQRSRNSKIIDNHALKSAYKSEIGKPFKTQTSSDVNSPVTNSNQNNISDREAKNEKANFFKTNKEKAAIKKK